MNVQNVQLLSVQLLICNAQNSNERTKTAKNFRAHENLEFFLERSGHKHVPSETLRVSLKCLKALKKFPAARGINPTFQQWFG